MDAGAKCCRYVWGFGLWVRPRVYFLRRFAEHDECGWLLMSDYSDVLMQWCFGWCLGVVWHALLCWLSLLTGFEVDGAVLKVDDLRLQAELGVDAAKDPRYALC